MRRLATFFCLAVCLCSTAAFSANTVVLKESVRVAGNYVRLGDLAEISGPDASSLAKVTLMKMPDVKSGIRLGADFIGQKVATVTGIRPDVKGSGVAVSLEYREVTEKWMKDLFVREVMKKSPWRDSAEVVIENIKVPSNLSVPARCRNEFSTGFSSREDFLGLTNMRITFGRGAGVKRARVSGKVRVIAEVPVVSKRIRRGQMLTPESIQVREIDITSYPPLVMNVKDLESMRAKTTLREGRPVLLNGIEKMPAICRGDMVTIEARSGAILVTDRGIALADGQIEEKISVRNATSGRQIFGTIIAPSTVRVEF